MRRRDTFRLATGGAAGLFGVRAAAAEAKVERATRGMPSPKIKDVRVIATAPAGLRLVVVKITTDQDGLYGYGCATFTQRADLVVPAVEKYLKPFLIGKPADRIEDTWQALLQQLLLAQRPGAEQRHQRRRPGAVGHQGPPGRDARLPAARRQVPRGGRLLHAASAAPRSRRSSTARAQGHGAGLPPRPRADRRARHGRLRRAARRRGAPRSRRSTTRPVFEPGGLHPARARAARGGPQAAGRRGRAAARRPRAGLAARRRVQFCQGRRAASSSSSSRTRSRPRTSATSARSASSATTPLAMGELFNSPHEWTPLIAERLIDYIRIHISQAGGLTPCRKMAAAGRVVRRQDRLARPGRRLARRPRVQRAPRPGQLQLRHPGVRRHSTTRRARSSRAARDLKDGYLYANEAPGWGIEVDEKVAAKYPFGHGETGERQRLNGGWGEIRRLDGTVIKQ